MFDAEPTLIRHSFAATPSPVRKGEGQRRCYVVEPTTPSISHVMPFNSGA